MTRRKLIILVVALTGITVLAFALYQRHLLKQGRKTPPPVGVAVASENIKSSWELPDGFVVWSSNRFGNHDILRMDLPDGNITQLTNHPHTEYFPRISPDGRFVAFSRSHQPWMSQRNQSAWDVILLDIESGEERLLAKNANTPTWSTDGKFVYFLRNSHQFVEHEVATGEERIVFESGHGDVKQKSVLQTPHISPANDQMAITLRNKQNMTSIIDLEGNVNRISGGCQLTWNKSGDFLYFIDHGGHMKNALYYHDPATGESRKWLDMPGEFSHEYFPKLSNDERYMVLGSSAGGHEHDSADYEIFLWRPDSPADSTVRLTYHTGNDNWPDIYVYDD